MDNLTQRPAEKYRVVQYGGGFEELDRFGVRDRIRAGEIHRETELSLVGSDDWRAADSFPQLVRYFDLAATSSSARLPNYGVAVAPPRVVEPMSERIVQGMLYPLQGGQVVTLLMIAVFSALPIVWMLAAVATVVTMLDVIRKSADGSTKMPGYVEGGDLPNMLRLCFAVFFVTLVALLPAYSIFIWAIVAVFMKWVSFALAAVCILAALALGALYYPACLATVAVWDNFLAALNPMYVYRVVKTVGRDYFLVVAMWFVATLATTIAKIAPFSPMTRLPLIGGILSSAISLWVLFYASHLLGYAIYRHAPELGWE